MTMTPANGKTRMRRLIIGPDFMVLAKDERRAIPFGYVALF